MRGQTNTSSISQFRHFYDVTEHFAKRFDKVGRQLAFHGKTRRHTLAWQKTLTARLRALLGMDTFESTRLRPRLQGREDRGVYWREDWILHTEPDVIAPFYVLVPKDIVAGERRPVVICPHGHFSAGRFAPSGRRDIECVREFIERYHYDYAVKLVERGFVTLTMDARGFGQRRMQHLQRDKETPAHFLASSCHLLMLMGHSLGQTVVGMWVWDWMRLLDYIATRPECDATRIGCAGLSTGGLQTLFLTALDPRVQAAVVSGNFYGVKDSVIRLASHCDCNCIPHLWEYADLGDVGGLVAPRGLFIETGDQDEMNGARGLANVYSQVRIARRVFRALGFEAQLAHHVFRGGHRWCGTRAIPWLEKQLGLVRSPDLVDR